MPWTIWGVCSHQVLGSVSESRIFAFMFAAAWINGDDPKTLPYRAWVDAGSSVQEVNLKIHVVAFYTSVLCLHRKP